MSHSRPIKSDYNFEQYRREVIDLRMKRVLVTNLRGSAQEMDLTVPANCDGFGRVRHFRRLIDENWPEDPLPIDPACKALGTPSLSMIRAQAFQIASCNWHCWYCFVPHGLLSADPNCSSWFSASELIGMYLMEKERPLVIDLTGGNPELVPEWVLWMMTELRNHSLDQNTYLWSDDNLSTDFFWTMLNEKERKFIADYPNYGRVGCFKGFDSKSFSFNTGTEPLLFDRQFELMDMLLRSGIDIYAYVTFTTPNRNSVSDDMRRFVDRLQSLHEYLPLRTIPLKIKVFTPVKQRITKPIFQTALDNQQFAVEAWKKEIENRFTCSERSAKITDIPIANEFK